MIDQKYSCEISCPCQNLQAATKFIVLTGGPGAGKTAVLEFCRKIFCQHVAILPEAATILFGGGFWRINTPTATMAAQKAIYHIQSQMEGLVANEKRWAIGLCDRGTIDGMAYWPLEGAKFSEVFQTSLEKEYAKYVAVIHLRSPNEKNGYNHQNPVRIETAAEAAAIDQKIHQLWKDHAGYHEIDCTPIFLEKVNKTTSLIRNYLPECCLNHLGKLK